MSFTITTLTAIVSVDENGEEGVMAATVGSQWMPLIAADETRLATMFPIAQEISQKSGMKYRVVQFSTREDITAEANMKYLHQ